MGDGLILRSARKHVRNLRNESDVLMELHQEAMECRDCDAFVQLCIDAHDWLNRFEQDLIEEENKPSGKCTTESRGDLDSLYRDWLVITTRAKPWMESFEARGFVVENIARFRECYQRVADWVRVQDKIAANTLPNSQLQVYADYVAGVQSLRSG